MTTSSFDENAANATIDEFVVSLTELSDERKKEVKEKLLTMCRELWEEAFEAGKDEAEEEHDSD